MIWSPFFVQWIFLYKNLLISFQIECLNIWQRSFIRTTLLLVGLFLCSAAAKSLQLCPTLCDPIDGSPPGSRPWDSPGKNTGVGCHFLLQCMKVKSESEVAQSCLTLSDPMDCSLPGSSAHGTFQARVLEWIASAFSGCSSLAKWGSENA